MISGNSRMLNMTDESNSDWMNQYPIRFDLHPILTSAIFDRPFSVACISKNDQKRSVTEAFDFNSCVFFAKKWLANDCTWNINLLVIKRSKLFPRGHFYSEIKISGTFKVTCRSFQGHSKVIKVKDIPVKVFFQMLLKILGYIDQNFEFDLAKGLILGTWLLRSLVLSVPVTHFDLSSSSDLTFWSRDLTKSSYMLSL